MKNNNINTSKLENAVVDIETLQKLVAGVINSYSTLLETVSVTNQRLNFIESHIVQMKQDLKNDNFIINNSLQLLGQELTVVRESMLAGLNNQFLRAVDMPHPLTTLMELPEDEKLKSSQEKNNPSPIAPLSDENENLDSIDFETPPISNENDNSFVPDSGMMSEMMMMAQPKPVKRGRKPHKNSNN